MVTILKSEEIQYNFNSFNQLRNTFNLRVIDCDYKYPKHLLIQSYKWFVEWAKEYYIDYTKYMYVTITKWDCEYQVNFYTDISMNKGGHFGLCRIYYDSKNKKILQA